MLLVGVALILIGAGLIWFGVPGNPPALVIGIIVLIIGALITFGEARDSGAGALLKLSGTLFNSG